MKRIALVILFVSLIAFASAESLVFNDQSSYIFRQYTVTDLKIRLFDQNNTLLTSNGNNCTISIQRPDFTNLVTNRTMTQTSDYYNYTLTANMTSTVGKHTSLVYCSGSDSTKAFSTFSFLVTPTGTELETSESLIYLFLLLLALFLLFFFIMAAVYIPYGNERNEEGYLVNIKWRKYLKMLFIVLAYVTLVWLNYVAYHVILGFTALTAAAQFFFVIHRIFLSMLAPFLIIFVIFTLIKIVSDIKLSNEIKKWGKHK